MQLGPRHRDACVSQGTSSCRRGLIVTVAEVLDHTSFIANLIKSRGMNQMIFCPGRIRISRVNGYETYANPNNANPICRDLLDIGKAPIGETGDDRSYKPRQAEGSHQRIRRTLHEAESMGASDKDKHLRNNGDLEVVDDAVQLLTIVAYLTRWGMSNLRWKKSDSRITTTRMILYMPSEHGRERGAARTYMESVMIVPLSRSAMIRTMKGGNLNPYKDTGMAKQITIQILTALV